MKLPENYTIATFGGYLIKAGDYFRNPWGGTSPMELSDWEKTSIGGGIAGKTLDEIKKNYPKMQIAFRKKSLAPNHLAPKEKKPFIESKNYLELTDNSYILDKNKEYFYRFEVDRDYTQFKGRGGQSVSHIKETHPLIKIYVKQLRFPDSKPYPFGY